MWVCPTQERVCSRETDSLSLRGCKTILLRLMGANRKGGWIGPATRRALLPESLRGSENTLPFVAHGYKSRHATSNICS